MIAGSVSEAANAEAYIAQEIFQQAGSAGVAACFLHLGKATERPKRCCTRGIGRHAVGDQLFDVAVEMAAQLVVQILFDEIVAEQCPGACSQAL